MNQRLERVNELLRREISTVLQRDFEFSNALVTINGVEVSRDLKEAKVFLGILGGSSRGVVHQVSQKRALIQSRIAKRITLRRTPVLHFYNDTSSEKGVSMVQLLEEVDKLPKAPPLEDTEETPPNSDAPPASN